MHSPLQSMSLLFSCSVVSNSLATPWTVAHHTPLSMEFFKQEYQVGCQSLLQGVFLTQGWNPHLLHWQVNCLPLSHQGSPLQSMSSPFFLSFFYPALAHWHYLPSHPWPVFSPLLKGQLKSLDLMKINEIINPSGYGIINERQTKGEKWKGKDRNRRLHSDWHKHHSLFAAGTRGAQCLCITVVKRHKVHKLTSVVGEHSHIRKGFQSPGHCHVRPLSLSLTSKEGREESTLATAQEPGNLSGLTVEQHRPDNITTGY